MQRLAEICIQRPVFATMMSLALIIVGLVSYNDLGVDRVPSVDLPTVRVRTALPGAAPEEVEAEVTEIIEEAVNTVEGIEELRSVSGPGSSFVIATFGLDRDIDVAAQDIRDRVSTVLRDLPDDTDPPQVSKVNNDGDAVLTLALSGPRSIRELTELADKIVRVQLERSRGVGEVQVSGDLLRTMNIWIRADRLDALGIPITAVRDALLAQNADVPGGNVTAEQREQTLRTMGRLLDAQSFNDMIVANVDGVPIRVRDLGWAEDGTSEQRTIARLNGQPTVVLDVVRQSGANTIEVIESAKASLDQIRGQLPADVSITITRDQSIFIRAALHEITVHLVLGSVLATLVVLCFMRNWRSTIIAAVAIPTSVIATFAMMWAMDFTLNSVTMLAIVLMVGVVIDDAIVVLENIFRFVEEKRMKPREAAVAATKEIGFAVLATTLSLVVIFVPVSFMSSVSGRFLYQFGLTAAVAVLVSLFVSFSLTPMMASRMLHVKDTAHGQGQAASRRGFYSLIERSYLGMLGWSMRHRVIVSLIALAVSLSSIPLLGVVKREFVPADVDEAEFGINITGPEGASVNAMLDVTKAIEEKIRHVPGVQDVLATSGGGFIGQVNQARFYVRIAPHEERLFSLGRLWRETLAGNPLNAFRGNYSQQDVMTAIDRILRTFPDIRGSVRNFQSFDLGGAPFDIDFVVRGPDLRELYEIGEGIRQRGLEIGGFRGLDTTLRITKPELRVEIDRDRAADLGASARDIGTAMRLMVGGDEEITRFRDPETNEQYDVRLRLEPSDRTSAELIEQLRIPSAHGGLVQLSNVASLTPALAPSRIDRLDRQRMVAVRGGVAPGFALQDRIDTLRGITEEMNLPPAYTTSLAGRSRELERTFNEFAWAFLLSIVFMYLILASQFESVVHPITILISLPLAVPFALFSIWATGGTLNLFSALGILVLFGVVKKNSILQIDHMNGLRRLGMPRLEAIMAANRDRLRPILMTTLSLVAGMLPLALGTGPGAEERRAVAVVVIGGQSLCLLLTLLVTPVAYSLLDDLGLAVTRRKPGADGAIAGAPAAHGD